ncbi:MAG TPA: histidine utilization repressor [Aliidongia sp.]|uniref:histidine utilization repressor n=1 Tax=Aliidongia sp. TaxID=1914230 RepID=UPI002DDCB383|nr:histidine utilization repressor [Aliidongia sp.]HEV2676335.1 histidine utilization repressor [Aliidongia sp.]
MSTLEIDDGPLPLYQRIKRGIVRKIDSGAWGRDQRIPSENELVRVLGVSRMTVNRAFSELADEGVLIRIHGVGTFVGGGAPLAPLMEIRNIADEIAQRDHRHGMRLLCREVALAPTEIAGLFDVAPGRRLFHTIIVHTEDDLPVQLEDRYVNPALAPAYLDQDFATITPHQYLMAVAPLSEGEHLVEAVLTEAWEAGHLRIELTEPCLLVRRRTWSDGGLVSSARLLYPGSRYRLGGRFEKTSGG